MFARIVRHQTRSLAVRFRPRVDTLCPYAFTARNRLKTRGIALHDPLGTTAFEARKLWNPLFSAIPARERILPCHNRPSP
jgi:hypothetical protein